MRFALVQPNWEFAGSSYFGCRDTHLPLELLFARQQLEAAGHETLLLDGHLAGLTPEQAAPRVRAFDPDFTVITTAPSYLFWRCPQPELRVPAQWLRAVCSRAIQVAIGPHGSATPVAAGEKLGCQVVLRGEPDQILPRLATGDWAAIPGCCWRDERGWHVDARTPQAEMTALRALDFHDYPLERRFHRHHVFSGNGRGAELEATRGCPWACDFCNKTLFRNRLRQRRADDVLAEAEALARAGFDYVYFIDEIFGCGRGRAAFLRAWEELPLAIGLQTRIDLWDEDSLAALGRAHCISMECGIESITPQGREQWRKGCRLSTERIAALLCHARRHIPWVQANLIAAEDEDLAAVEAWRQALLAQGVWVSKPVPAYPFPGSPLYAKLFGPPDGQAWERAHTHYLGSYDGRGYYSDIQDAQPSPLAALENREPMAPPQSLGWAQAEIAPGARRPR